jgi:uncharacterized membrane protein YkvA (DUF1232 family)
VKVPRDLNERVSLLAQVVRNARLVWRLLQDARVPAWTKLILPAALVYLVSPIDFVPDWFLGLGELDDLAILLLGLWLFLELVPKTIVREHQADMARDAMDVSYRVVDEEKQREPDATGKQPRLGPGPGGEDTP